jgi:hypothetical protein
MILLSLVLRAGPSPAVVLGFLGVGISVFFVVTALLLWFFR